MNYNTRQYKQQFKQCYTLYNKINQNLTCIVDRYLLAKTLFKKLQRKLDFYLSVDTLTDSLGSPKGFCLNKYYFKRTDVKRQLKLARSL